MRTSCFTFNSSNLIQIYEHIYNKIHKSTYKNIMLTIMRPYFYLILHKPNNLSVETFSVCGVNNKFFSGKKTPKFSFFY